MHPDIIKLQKRIELLERLVGSLTRQDRIYFSRNITVTDGVNLEFSSSTGTKIGTGTSQKLGFYNATPVDQPATIADPSGGATQDAEARTAINALIDRLQELGLIA